MPEPAVAPVDIDNLTIQADSQPDTVTTSDSTPPADAEVVVNGIKYIVTPEMAKDMKAEQEKAQKDKAILQQQILAKPPIDPPVTAPVVEIADNGIGDRIFTEPDKVLGELEQRIEKKLRTEYERNEAQKTQTQKNQVMLDEFYKVFFSANKELVEDRGLVELIFEKNFSNWAALHPRQPDKWKELLAEQSQKTILRNVKRNSNDVTKQSLVLESGGQASIGVTKVDSKDEKPVTLTSVIKARSRARRASA